MTENALTTTQVLTMLAAGPARIAVLTAELAPAQLHASPVPGEWSAKEVLAHLRACADMWGKCMTEILILDHPTLRAINPTTWIDKTDYRAQSFARSLAAFAAQRTELLAMLTPLTPSAWARAATVISAGRPLERTVLFYAAWLARHERPHIKQIARIVRAMQSGTAQR